MAEGNKISNWLFGVGIIAFLTWAHHSVLREWDYALWTASFGLSIFELILVRLVGDGALDRYYR